MFAQKVQPLLEAPGLVVALDAGAGDGPKRRQVRPQVVPAHPHLGRMRGCISWRIGGAGARIPGFDRQAQAWIGHDAPPHHQGMAARLGTRAQRVWHIPDFTVGHQRDLDHATDVFNARPIRWGPITVGLGARMHHDFTGSTRLQRLGAGFGTAVVVKPQAHLGRHHLVRRHRAAHRTHDLKQHLGVLQQGRATAMAVDLLGRAAKVQVHAIAAHARHTGGVVGQAIGVRAQQLRTHRHPGRRAPSMGQLGHHTQKRALGQQGVGDTDELRHAAVNAAHTGQHIAQHTVEQALHGGKDDHWGGSLSRGG